MKTEDYVSCGLLAGLVGVALGIAGCASSGEKLPGQGTGGWSGAGGALPYGSGGSAGSTVGGIPASGGNVATGGWANGGAPAVGGSPSTGGTIAMGGMGMGGTGTGGTGTGGMGMGGTGKGGSGMGRGGFFFPFAGGSEEGGAENGGSEEGGAENGGSEEGGEENGGSEEGGAGDGAGGSGSTTLDCDAPMPTGSNGTHCGSYRTGRAGDSSWELWSNAYNGNACITYYNDTPAFSATWNNNNDFLARLGIEWGGKSISQLGTVTAEFTNKKSGSSGGYSYIGIYGWATSPCVEYYIIDDSFNGMPFNPWGMNQKGSATIDGETYKFYSGMTGGTGGNRCGTSGQFNQYWSVRQSGRSCGVITITDHFAAWKDAGMGMDNILEAKILVESGGGQGSIEFPIANVKASNMN